MHLAGVCTDPDVRQAAAISNFGISPSAAAATCKQTMLTHAESRVVYFMGVTPKRTNAFLKWTPASASELTQINSHADFVYVSALGQKADVCNAQAHVRFEPEAKQVQYCAICSTFSAQPTHSS